MAKRATITWTKKGYQTLISVTEYRAKFVGTDGANLFQIELLDHIKEKLVHPERYAPCRNKILQENGCRCLTFRKNWIIVFRVDDNVPTIFGIVYARSVNKAFGDLVK